MERWNGKVAVVTGASAGIGAAIAQQLVDHGLKVIGLARRVERIEEMSKKMVGVKGVLHALKVDISKPTEVIAAFATIEKRFGPIHILVNNAGVSLNTTLIDGDLEKWKNTFDVNVIGLCVASREAIASMKKNNVDGHIVHINSVVGHFVPSETTNVYAATKHAVTALTEGMRVELMKAQSKIKVTSVSPGFVGTEILQAGGFTIPKEILGTLPSLHSEDVADSVVYALSTPPHVQVHELMVRPLGGMY